MAQEKNQKEKPEIVVLRYTCDLQGEQVGLSHYLMVQERRNR